MFFGLEGSFRIHFFAVGVWCRKNRSQMDIFGLSNPHPSSCTSLTRAKTRVWDARVRPECAFSLAFFTAFAVSLRKHMVKFRFSLQLRGAMTWKPSGPCGFALLENGGFSPRRRAVFFGLEGGFRIHFFAVGVWCRKNRGQMDIFGFTDDHVFKLRSCVGSPSAILRRLNIIHHLSLNRDRTKTRV